MAYNTPASIRKTFAISCMVRGLDVMCNQPIEFSIHGINVIAKVEIPMKCHLDGTQQYSGNDSVQ